MQRHTEIYSSKELARIFERAISPTVYEQILAMDPPPSMELKEHEALGFFVDIRGMTELHNRLGPREFQRKLVSLFEDVTEVAKSLGGYAVMYIGDAMLLVFGAPIARPAGECVLAAAELAKHARAAGGKVGFPVGCGYHWGPVEFGSLSPPSRPNYSALGVTLNIASRLERMSGRTGGREVVAESVRELLGTAYRTAYFDMMEASDIPSPIATFAVIGRVDEIDAEDSNFWDRYDVAMEEHRNENPEEALRLMSALSDEREGEALIMDALGRVRRSYAESLRSKFGDSLSSLPKVLADSALLLFDESKLALLEPDLDGMWRFHAAPQLARPEALLAPDGDAIVWLRGLNQPALTSQAPKSLHSLPFSVVAPLRKDNQLAAALFISSSREIDLAALGIVADALAEPWTARRVELLRERYREKVDDAQKLQRLNQELEAKSVALVGALEEIRTMNAELEERVQNHALRLERASTLKRYLPPSVVEEILDGRRDLAPRNERKKLTVLFSDVRGFTSATDGLEPEELARLLDEYLSFMSRIAFDAGATIDKFRGDGMMVFFGAPKPMEPKEGAVRCVRMAVEMCRGIDRLRAKWFSEGYDWDLGVRMGINTGYASVGEFGSKDRLDYTAIGTEVNVAARLENACDTDSILISHSTWALVQEEFACAPRGTVELKGIHRPVRVYEIAWQEEETV